MTRAGGQTARASRARRTPWVQSLEQLDGAGSIEIAGGKAANLGVLLRASFHVPTGFCVTTDAYARVADTSALATVIERLRTVPAQDVTTLAALAEAARDALLAASMPTEVRAAIERAYGSLGRERAVAVRSSATAEDLPDASFAGQQDTYLNIVGTEALIDAVRRCWASLWTDRAVAYRASHAIDPATVKLAVVVQVLVPARVAGVLFTANPVTGTRGRAVIDASPGLGEAVVSGAVNPDHFEVDAANRVVLSRRPGDKRVRIEPADGGGTRRVTEAATDDTPCITDDEAVALAVLGARVEAHFGTPQDLEWALDADRTIWLLQSRPITTLHALPTRRPEWRDDELRVYFSFNVAQGVPRPLTPFGVQAWRMMTGSLARIAGFAPESPYAGPSILRDAHGRVYLDVTPVLRHPIGRALGQFALARMETRSAAMVAPLLADARLSLLPTRRARLARFALRAAARTRAPIRMIESFFAPAAAVTRVKRAADEALALGDVPHGAGVAERLAAVERLMLEGVPRVFLRALPSFVPGLVCLRIARKLLADVATDTEIDEVLRALPHNPTTEMDLELWSVARAVRDDPDVRTELRATPPSTLAERYRQRTLPAALQSQLETFLAKYGARGVAEIDVGMPRWHEDPTHILGSLANYLALDRDAVPPDEQFARAARDAEAAVDELVRRARAKGRVRGWLARLVLSRVRALAGGREAPKFYVVRLFARAREHLLAVGDVWSREGRLTHPDDVFFLTMPELWSMLAGDDLRSVVRTRRAHYDRELSRRNLPRLLLSDGTDVDATTERATGDHLEGSPASAGRVTARARVVLDPVGARLEPGEILVAPSTDPGWTPLFLTAGGLVMEMGGSMSHGAVVAREYGIPAVVGVPHATERIRTGQRLTVDGAAGTVVLGALDDELNRERTSEGD